MRIFLFMLCLAISGPSYAQYMGHNDEVMPEKEYIKQQHKRALEATKRQRALQVERQSLEKSLSDLRIEGAKKAKRQGAEVEEDQPARRSTYDEF